MYIPQHFAVEDEDEALAFVEQNAFGSLVSSLHGRLFVSHLPFLVSSDRQKLIGHLAKANPHWQELEDQEVLVSFLGDHAYVSPTWYSSPGVPTWNYQSVQVYGKVTLIQDADAVEAIVLALTNKYEARDNPWTPQYKATQLQAIIGIEIRITEIECKFKLSQNRPEEDQLRVADKFREQGMTGLSNAMQKLTNKN